MKSKMIETDSIAELAEFWDSNDLTDVEDTLEEVSEPVFRHRTVVQVPFQSAEVDEIGRVAASRGLATPDLIREWVLDKLAI